MLIYFLVLTAEIICTAFNNGNEIKFNLIETIQNLINKLC